MKKKLFAFFIMVAFFVGVASAKEVKYDSADDFYEEFNDLLSDNDYAEIVLFDYNGNHESGFYWNDGGLRAYFNGQILLVYFHSDFHQHFQFSQLRDIFLTDVPGSKGTYMKNMECSYDKNKVIKEWNRLIDKM